MSTNIHEELVDRVAADLNIDGEKVRKIVTLLDEGCTVPFICRYRRELCGELDLEKVREIDDRYRDLLSLRTRKRTILKSLRKVDKLTPELEARIEACDDKASLEDIYLPYRARRDSIARAAELKGLRPYAEEVLVFDPPADIDAVVEKAVAELDGVSTPEEAREGIRDILAELFTEDAEVRGRTRELARKEGRIVSRAVAGKEEEPSRFKSFYNFSEPATSIPSHRLLAIRRGEKEGFLSWGLDFDRGKVLDIMKERIRLSDGTSQAEFLEEVIQFAADNLLKPSIAREVRAETKRRADEESIRVFCDNLRDMLLASPVGPVTVIGVDPTNRTGTRLAVVDGAGDLLESAVLYLDPGDEAKLDESARALKDLVEKHRPLYVAVGNGTTSLEAEKVLRRLLARMEDGPGLVMINEAGVSVYASSEAAKRELPNLDVADRAAVSMARRIQDPLAELVKIDPRSIGVGQYQHDVNQTLLRHRLSEVVSFCVNHVGANVASASPQYLSYVSGLNPVLAEAIVDHRARNGPFISRARLMDVKGVGPRTFEQCAGFLRVSDSEIPLDNTEIHPESYHIVERIAADLGKPLDELMGNHGVLDEIAPEKYVDEKAGLPTITHILEQLKKPGFDPREPFQPVRFRADVTDITDLEVGMELEGRVSNVTRFGAFVDVGVHHDGLVHVSEISSRFVSDPSEAVRVGQVVKVRVIGVETGGKRSRLSLSMKPASKKPARRRDRREGKGSRRSAPARRDRMRTLEDLLKRFGDPRKPRLDQE